MSRKDIEFKTGDNVTLRGWLYTPTALSKSKLPCLIMSHDWTAVKEMSLDNFAEAFVSKLSVICLVFDNRGFGSSDIAPGQPRLGMLKHVFASNIDTISNAQEILLHLYETIF